MRDILANCRYLLVLPVIGCLLLTAGVVIMGMGRVFTAGVKMISDGDFSAKSAKIAALAVIEVIDLFLVGTVSYIAAVGIYKLFLSDAEVRLPTRLRINNLKDLEDKIIGVIVAALAVAFLGQAAAGDEPADLLSYGGGIALVITALAIFMRFGEKSGKAASDKAD